ncbi:MAG: T9SS type A sorting domain-containing protein [Ignavibacteriae bacterium]|nr:T9SS type A sorting domain-containing protein [Ignavibacteriota bacterium]
MNASRLFALAVMLVMLFCQFTIAQKDSLKQRTSASPYAIPPGKSHEQYFEELYKQQPQQFIKPPQLRSPSLFPNVSVSNDTFPQNEPSIRISHKNSNRMVAAWRDFRTGVEPAVRRVGYSFSNDGGLTWSPSELLPLFYQDIGYTRNSDPAVCVDTAGNFYIATVALDDNNGNLKLLVYKSSEAFGDFFYQAYFAPTDTENLFYDKEYIECDLSPTSPFVNNLYIVWSGTRFTRSTDGGITWSHALEISDPGNGGFAPDLAIGPDGSVNVVSYGDALILFDKSTDGGLSFGTDVIVDSVINLFTCSFGGFVGGGLPSIAADLTMGPTKGHLYIVWPDTRNGDFDVFLKVSSDSGSTWSEARRVNDDPVGNGRDQFWPWVAVDDRGVVTIVYYDNRNTSDCSISETYLAHSWDGGRSFTNRLISTAQSPHNIPNGAVRFGDYIGIDSWGGHTVPVWTDERAGGFDMDIYTAVLDTLPLINFSGVTLITRSRWNLLSLPVLHSNPLTQSIFQGASTSALAYDGSYHPEDTLQNGVGYWIKFPTSQTIRIIGDTITTDTLPVIEGWNLIGSITKPVAVTSIVSDPPGITTTRFFDYAGTYFITDTIEPGKGYWVKAGQAGSIILSSSTSAASIANRIRIMPTSEQPPLPPQDISSGHPLPNYYSLENNYPNPFNPKTTIDFSLAEPSIVTLKVYNVLGQQVATLLNREEFEEGQTSIEFNATQLTSGIYFYKFTALSISERKEQFQSVRRMLLLK